MDLQNAEQMDDCLSGKKGRLVPFSAPRRAGTTTSAAIYATKEPMCYVHHVESLRRDFLLKVQEQARLKGYQASEISEDSTLVLTEPDGTRSRFPGNVRVLTDESCKRELVPHLSVWVSKPYVFAHRVYAFASLPVPVLAPHPIFVDAWHDDVRTEVLEDESESAVVVYFRQPVPLEDEFPRLAVTEA